MFFTTRWSVVLAAQDRASPGSAEALETLCRAYWYPLYAYVRRRGYAREDGEDLVQGFFARFLQRNDLAGLGAERGRFRAYLLASLKHFLANEWDKTQRQKRGGQVTHLSLDWQDAHERYHLEPADELSPDRVYDREWAVALLDRVLSRLRDDSAAEGKARLFEQLRPVLMVGREAVPYARLATELGLSEGAARVTVHRLRRRYRELLRDEIAQTLADPSQVEEEIRALFAAFAG